MEQIIIDISTDSNEFKKEKRFAEYYYKSNHNLYSNEKFRYATREEKEKIYELMGDLKAFNEIIDNSLSKGHPINLINKKNKELESLVYSLNCALVIRNFFENERRKEEYPQFYFKNIDGLDSFVQNYIMLSKTFKKENLKRNANISFPYYIKSLDFFYSAAKDLEKRIANHSTNEIILKLNGKRISTDFSSLDLYSKGIEKKIEFGMGSTEKVVGNDELVNKLKLGVRFLMFYNKNKKRNELDEFIKLFSVLFVYGPPGSGKTLAIRNAISELDYLAYRFNRDYSIIELDNSFKSGIFNESIKNLKQIDKQIKKGDKVYLIVADDIDTIFFPRNGSNHSTEEKKIFGQILSILEGIQMNSYGNSFFIATSNSPDSIDSALLQRLNKNSVYAKGPHLPEHYKLIFINKLKKGIEKGYIKIKNWDIIGEFAYRLGIGGRGVDNICARIGEKVIDYKKIDTFFNHVIANKKPENVFFESSTILSMFNKIDDSLLIEEIVKYSNEIKKQKASFIDFDGISSQKDLNNGFNKYKKQQRNKG